MQIQAIPLPEQDSMSMECEVHCESPNTPASSMEDIASVVSSASPTKEASSQAPAFDPVKEAAEFVLSLRQGHHISQKCIERVIEHTDLLLKSTVAAVQSRLENVLDENNTVQESLSEIFQSSLPSFDGVTTISQQRKQFHHHFGLLVCELLLHYVCTRLHYIFTFNRNHSLLYLMIFRLVQAAIGNGIEETKCTPCVPIIQTLKNLFKILTF